MFTMLSKIASHTHDPRLKLHFRHLSHRPEQSLDRRRRKRASFWSALARTLQIPHHGPASMQMHADMCAHNLSCR